MIVCKKPCTLFDVDLLGLGVLAALGLAAWWLVVAPWRQMWSDYAILAAQRASAEAALQADSQAWERYQQGLTDLERTVAGQLEAAPRVATLAQQLRRMTELAEAADLEVTSVVPQPAEEQGAYLVSDIAVSGRGRAHDFIRFLDRLAQENPHQSLEACAVRRNLGDGDLCDLAWTIRMYLLPDQDRPQPGAAP